MHILSDFELDGEKFTGVKTEVSFVTMDFNDEGPVIIFRAASTVDVETEVTNKDGSTSVVETTRTLDTTGYQNFPFDNKTGKDVYLAVLEHLIQDEKYLGEKNIVE